MASNFIGKVLFLLVFTKFIFLSSISSTDAVSCDLPNSDPETAYTEAVNYLTANGTHVVNVCLYQVSPIGFCEAEVGTITIGNASGFMPSLFTQLAEYIGLFSAQYNFLCWYDTNAMVADIVNGRGQCDISVADLDVRPNFILKGVKFPLSLYTQGLQVVSPTYIASTSLWEFFFPFSWELWVAWIFTILFSATSLYYMERLTVKESDLICRPGLKGLLRAHWYVLGQAVNVVSIEHVQSFGGRIFGLAFGFLMLVLVSLFTANMAAFVTTRQKLTRVNSLADIAGKVVATYENYTGILEPYNPSTIIYLPWNTEQDETNMVNGLLDGAFDALVIDSPFASYISSQYCGFATVGEAFREEFLSMALPPNSPVWVSLTLENALSSMQKKFQTIDSLITQYLDVPDTCDGQKIVASSQVEFKAVAGLWIIVGAGTALGILATVYSACKRHNWGPEFLFHHETQKPKKPKNCFQHFSSWMWGIYQEPAQDNEGSPAVVETNEDILPTLQLSQIQSNSAEKPRVKLVEALMSLTLELATPEQKDRVARLTQELLTDFHGARGNREVPF